MLWLIEKSSFEQMSAALDAGYIPNAEEEASFSAKFDAVGGTRIMSVSSGNANINVSGVLTDAPDIMARIFGGGNTTYAEIRGALATAEADPDVKEIVMKFNSPGGAASAEMVDTFQAIRATKKPVTAFVGDMAASAAFGLAAQAGSIVAQNAMSKVGSVGVMVRSFVNPNVITTTSTNAPNKIPDPSTPEGKEKIRAMIDPMEKVFIDAIASGRGISAENVKEDFGKGAVVLAEQALRRNMIDSIAAPGTLTDTTSAKAQVSEKPQTKTAVGGKTGVQKMDLPTLKASHPAVFQAAYDEGKKKGSDDERDRVSAHLTYGTQCGCMDIAQAAIDNGSDVTQSLLAQYLTAGQNKNDITDRNEDETDASAADGAAESKTGTEEQAATEEKVVDAALKLAGMSVIEDEEVK